MTYNLNNSNVVYAGDRRSLDNGQTFARFAFPSSLDEADLQVMDLCRARPDTLYAASRKSGRILRSDDQGTSWRLYTTALGAIAPFDSIPTFAVDPLSCDVIYTLDKDGDLARYDGEDWKNLGLLAKVKVPSGYYTFVRAVLVDPRHSEILYAAMFGSGISQFFRSVDSGSTWQDVTYNHFRSNASGFNISPVTGEVMVGGCSGTWVLPPPYSKTNGVYQRLVPRPSCYDGIKNGEEQEVDSGGRCVSSNESDGETSNAGATTNGPSTTRPVSGGCGCNAGLFSNGDYWLGAGVWGLLLMRRRR